MIIYGTKQTIDRYKITLPENFENQQMRDIALQVLHTEENDSILEWGAKLFYFDGRKCLQICNFASKFTIVLVDVKKKDLELVGDTVVRYMLDIYSDNKDMIRLIERLFREHPLLAYSKLTNRKIISTMNRFQSIYLEDGYRLYDFISDGVLHTRELNKQINCDYLVTDKVDGKTQYFYPIEKFATLLKEYFDGR